ncbi:MFS transporter [Streptomyces sp. NPDC014889]|uniref:MFS transporter n=1 Tax=Streptomyces sp. NPDC014889 TaxID=3364928 RepID=UPI0037015885
MGITEGAFTPTAVAATAEASRPERRGLNMGMQQSTFALFGIGLGPIIATQLLRVLPSWHWVFGLMPVPGLVLAWFVFRTIRESDQLPAFESAVSPAAQEQTQMTGHFGEAPRPGRVLLAQDRGGVGTGPA